MHRIIVNVFNVLLLFLLISCENGKKRNCFLEYADISERDFSHPLSAISTTQDYLSYFSKSNCGYVDEVEKIQKEFMTMKEFLEKKRTITQWCKDSPNAPFSTSAYLSVKNTWITCKTKADNNYFSSARDRIDSDMFRNSLRDYAISVCRERWSGGVFSGWTVTSYEENEIGSSTNLDGIYGKKCSGIYTIHLEKGLLGSKKGSAKVKVEGRLVYKVDGSLFFERINYEIIQTNGRLD